MNKRVAAILLLLSGLALGCNGIPMYKSALEDAVVNGHVGWTRRILESGVHPDAAERYSTTPLLMDAVCERRYEIAELLLQYGADADSPIRLDSGEKSIRNWVKDHSDAKMREIFARYPKGFDQKGRATKN